MKFSNAALAKSVILLPLMGGSCRGFAARPQYGSGCAVAPSARTNEVCARHVPPCAGRRRPSLGMSYLDDLSSNSSPQRDEEREEGMRSSSPWASRSGGVGGGVRTGGVPSGRGPEKSYLEDLTGGDGGGGDGGSEENDGRDPSLGTGLPPISDFTVPPEKEKKPPASWSNTGAYLTGNDGGELGLMCTIDGGNDDSRTDVRNLLTQRSIQSFMYLLEECRDPHSAKWIQEDFLEAGNLLDFHGTGAGFIERFGGSWEAALVAMMDQPKSRIIIHAKRRGRGHGGWSKNNPFLKERFVQIPVNIDPVSLASRILDVREQIATEWTDDLDVVADANVAVLASYFARMRAARDEPEAAAASGEAAADRAFDRAEFSMPVGSSSPFRMGNYDLLYNLCTQAAIHRLLREDCAGGREGDSSHLWLRDFYVDRAAQYFDGEQPYGRADDFLGELLRTSPSLGGGMAGGGLSDPIGAVERILRKRGEVVEEWKDRMRHVQEEHNVYVRPYMLSKQAESWGALDTPPVVTARSKMDDEMGAFE